MNAELYLDLLKRTLSGMVYQDPSISTAWRPESVYNEGRRVIGRDWPMHAQTMIGLRRLENLQHCVETVIADSVPGDLIETGVWRGGACIFMRGILAAYDVTDRTVWVADSFDGFPRDLIMADDRALASQPEQRYLAVPIREVISNFHLYGLLDEQVIFIQGWFNETLPGPVKKLAVLRLDSDLYRSTVDSMSALYPLLEPGGFCIVDDWNLPMCRDAVNGCRDEFNITEPILDIDGRSIYWRKEG